MKYRWSSTGQTNNLLIKLEAQKITLEKTPKLPHVELALREKSLLKSAVYSARIEGLPDEETAPKKASQNLLKAYTQIYRSQERQLNIPLIKEFHQTVMNGLSASAGQFRSEPWAIFDQSGNAIYLAPMHYDVPKLMDEYIIDFVDHKAHPAITAGLAQFVFEKIHPFADGNGRVGRLISAFILEKNGFGFRGLVPFERFIESHRDGYYQTLENNLDATEFIVFFLEALTSELDLILDQVIIGEEKPEDLLLPRRREILAILSDHPYCSFDTIRRRFAAVNEKTLHNDLSQLIKKGFVQKVGSTRGAVYKKSLN